MRNLISGQTIRIDNHSRGDRKPTEWDREKIHIHKIMDNDRYNGADFSIYFDSSKPIHFNKIKGKTTTVESQLRNEITKAFRDKSKRAHFAKFITEELSKYSQNLPYNSKLKELESAAKQIGTQFGLRDNIKIEIEDICKDKILESIKQLTTKITDEEGKSIFILQDVNGKSITIGENLDLINDWENATRLFNEHK